MSSIDLSVIFSFRNEESVIKELTKRTKKAVGCKKSLSVINYKHA